MISHNGSILMVCKEGGAADPLISESQDALSLDVCIFLLVPSSNLECISLYWVASAPNEGS